MEQVKNENSATVYEYITVEVKAGKRDLILDTYENLGYEKTSNGFNTINFKRDRRINNRKELKAIERKVELSINNIYRLEESKKKSALIFALTVGILGCLVMGGGMALIMELEMMLVGIILGIVGIAACLPVYPIYSKMVETKTNKVIPLIEEEYDKLAAYCDEASVLLK